MSRGLEYKKGMGESVLKAQADRIAELEAREPLCRCADEVRCDYLNRIADLQEKLDVFDEMDEMLRICLKANVSMAEQLDRVRGLPEKWREDEDACAAWEQWRNGAHCADELQSALGDE